MLNKIVCSDRNLYTIWFKKNKGKDKKIKVPKGFTPSFLVYKAWADTTRSSKLHFDH
jgi:hypothetical protein